MAEAEASLVAWFDFGAPLSLGRLEASEKDLGDVVIGPYVLVERVRNK